MDEKTINLITNVLMAVLSGGLGSSVVVYFFTRKKTLAETEDVRVTTQLKIVKPLEDRLNRQDAQIAEQEARLHDQGERAKEQDKRIQTQNERITELDLELRVERAKSEAMITKTAQMIVDANVNACRVSSLENDNLRLQRENVELTARVGRLEAQVTGTGQQPVK